VSEDGRQLWAATKGRMELRDRAAQEELFEGLISAAEAGRVGFGNAPCGAGKSFAVIPLSAFMKGEGRVIHSSYTKAQQRQMARDGERLVKLGVFRQVVEVRGRGEYLCLRRRRQNLDFAGERLDFAELGNGFREDLARVLGRAVEDDEWAGSRSDSGGGCGNECGGDFANAARFKSVMPGALVVANHSILALDYILGGAVIGFNENDVLVLDEAHQFPDQLRGALGASITPRRFSDLWALVQDSDLTVPVEGPAGAAACRNFIASHSPTEGGKEEHKFLGPDDTVGGVMSEWVAAILGEVEGAAEPVSDEMKRVGRVAERLSADLRNVDRACLSEAWAAWVQRGKSIEARPLDVSEVTRRLLRWGSASAVLSATLRGHPLSELGGGELIDVGSPFDLGRQRQAVISLNGRGGRVDDEARLQELLRVARARRGGMLVLAPTNKMKVGRRWVSMLERCAETLEGAGMRVGVQRSPSDVADLVLGLQEKRYEVIVGTASLREGIDIKGEALAMVVLLTLPWPYMGDPMLQARIAKAGDAKKWDLLRPMMLTNLEQAVGRLIRDEGDEGHVVLLDGRANAVRDFQLLTKPSPIKELR
jgi:Rad3-related DNA helicase